VRFQAEGSGNLLNGRGASASEQMTKQLFRLLTRLKSYFGFCETALSAGNAGINGYGAGCDP